MLLLRCLSVKIKYIFVRPVQCTCILSSRLRKSLRVSSQATSTMSRAIVVYTASMFSTVLFWRSRTSRKHWNMSGEFLRRKFASERLHFSAIRSSSDTFILNRNIRAYSWKLQDCYYFIVKI